LNLFVEVTQQSFDEEAACSLSYQGAFTFTLAFSIECVQCLIVNSKRFHAYNLQWKETS